MGFYFMKLNIMTATLTEGDAIGNWTKTMRRIFSLKGFTVRIYADLFDGSIPCLPSSEYSSTGNEILWYHYSIYSENIEIIKTSKDFKIMDFHGVAPSWLFKGYNPELEALCKRGEEELPLLAPLFDYHITHSQYTYNILRDLNISKITKIPLPTDLHLFGTDGDPKYLEKLKNLDYLLFVGRIVPQKSILEIIEVFYHLKKRREGIKLFLIGGYEYSRAYLTQVVKCIKKLSLKNDVILTGKIANSRLLHSFFKQARFTIILSQWESFCVPIVESMFFGTPVIGIDVAAIPETMGSGGLLVKTRDCEEIAADIDRNWEGKQYDQLKENARIRGQQFTDQSIDQLVQSSLFPIIKPRLRSIKLAFVIHRYGQDITGGAEYLCRQLAEHLTPTFDIEILTSQARDYNTWENFYPAGEQSENGIAVRRFPVEAPRDIREFRVFNKTIFESDPNYLDQLKWMEKQGPRSLELIEYIQNNQSRYDLFVFFTYLYYSTFFGIQQVKDRAVLVPLAHNEPPFYLDLFSHLFRIPCGIIYCTETEKNFVERVIAMPQKNHVVAGIGMDIKEECCTHKIHEKYDLPEPYMVYCGRISRSKGCDKLFEYFLRYRKEVNSEVSLVVLGVGDYPVPSHSVIKQLGYVSEEDKNAIIRNAIAVINPSYFESLSIIVLEAWSLSTPVIVNDKCEVLTEHCEKSNGGLCYGDYKSFAKSCSCLLKNSEMAHMLGQNGYQYVRQHYSWDRITRMYTDFFIDFYSSR